MEEHLDVHSDAGFVNFFARVLHAPEDVLRLCQVRHQRHEIGGVEIRVFQQSPAEEDGFEFAAAVVGRRGGHGRINGLGRRPGEIWGLAWAVWLVGTA